MNFFSLAVADAQDPWASADALNAGSEVLQRPLQNISCTAPDACKMHQNTPERARTGLRQPPRPFDRRREGMDVMWGVSAIIWRLAGGLNRHTRETPA